MSPASEQAASVSVSPGLPQQGIRHRYRAWLNRWAQRILVPAFRQMNRGRLILSLPDGETLTLGDGVGVEARVQVQSDHFWGHCLLFGHVGFGEAYVAGDWDSPNVADVIAWAILNVDESPILEGSRRHWAQVNLLGALNRWGHWLHRNTQRLSPKNIRAHYDLSNELFATFLDETMTYSAARFEHPEQSLAQAQEAKYQALIHKMQIHPGDHVLEIGCGWGGFAEYAARTVGCRVTGITLSPSQLAYAQARIQRAGLAERVTLKLQDYRTVTGQFSKIVSIEMIEAVGDAYMDTFLAQCTRCLAPNGVLGLQMITCPDHRYPVLRRNVDFIQKHIFPGSLLPSLQRVTDGLHRAGTLNLVHYEDLASDYAQTLEAWDVRFTASLARVRALGFDEAFIRRWQYYLRYCQAAFEMRQISVVQAVFSRPNTPTLSRTPERWSGQASSGLRLGPLHAPAPRRTPLLSKLAAEASGSNGHSGNA